MQGSAQAFGVSKPRTTDWDLFGARCFGDAQSGIASNLQIRLVLGSWRHHNNDLNRVTRQSGPTQGAHPIRSSRDHREQPGPAVSDVRAGGRIVDEAARQNPDSNFPQAFLTAE